MVFSKKYTYKWSEEGFEQCINGYEDIDASDDLLVSGSTEELEMQTMPWKN